MEFVTEFDHIYGDTLFDAFDVDTFYEEIQRSPEYKAEHSRLIPRKKGLIKLEQCLFHLIIFILSAIFPLVVIDLLCAPVEKPLPILKTNARRR